MITLPTLPESKIEAFKLLAPIHARRILDREKYLVSLRLKEQKVIGGLWFANSRFVRRLSRDENIAYYSLIKH